MEYDKLAVNNQVYTWSEALGEVVDPQGARVVTGRDGSVSPQRGTRLRHKSNLVPSLVEIYTQASLKHTKSTSLASYLAVKEQGPRPFQGNITQLLTK